MIWGKKTNLQKQKTASVTKTNNRISSDNKDRGNSKKTHSLMKSCKIRHTT